MSSTTDNDVYSDGYEEAATAWREGHGKAMNICRSVSAIISLISSTLLVCIIFKTKDRLSTTYHRLLLGICIADLLASLSSAIFGVAVASEVAYLSWNASGNVTSCDAQGFIYALGAVAGVWYSCSLNLYYLVKIRFNRSDAHIKRKIEPWLHIVPSFVSLAISSACLAKELFNSSFSGTCGPLPYDPPHCYGVEEGVVPEGYEIPCWRGSEATVLIYIVGILGFLFPPVIIGISLFLIYKSVLKQEKRNWRYGAATLNANSANYSSANSSNATTDINDGRRKSLSSVMSSLKSSLLRRRRSSVSAGDNSNSRAVMHRAVAYALAYFITWIWFIGYMFL